MGFVLTTASSVHCPSSGTVGTEGQAKLKVAGSPVLRLDGIKDKPVSNCAVPDSSGPPPTVKCKNVLSASGAAAKLKVAGAGVALDTLTGATDGTTPALSASANQTKLKAV